MKYLNDALVSTGCKDCGADFIHTSPYDYNTSYWKTTYQDALVDVHYNFLHKHFLITIKTEPQRIAFSCSSPLESIIDPEQVSKILTWAIKVIKPKGVG